MTDADSKRTVRVLPSFCAPNAIVIWTRHRVEPDATPTIRRWFEDAGFEEVGFDAEPGFSYGVGTHRLMIEPPPFQSRLELFDFAGGE